MTVRVKVVIDPTPVNEMNAMFDAMGDIGYTNFGDMLRMEQSLGVTFD
jgi:hypothetical protein